MLTKTMKWVAIAMLLLAVLKLPSEGYQLLLEIVVSVSGVLVVAQAVRRGKYFWAAGFVAVAALFNPLVPVELSRHGFLLLDLVCTVTFLVSLGVLQIQPRLSIPSITNQTPGSESL